MDIPAPDAMLDVAAAGTGCDLAFSASSFWEGRFVAVVDAAAVDAGVASDTFTCSAGGGGGEADICSITLDDLLGDTVNASEVVAIINSAARAIDRKEEERRMVIFWRCGTSQHFQKALDRYSDVISFYEMSRKIMKMGQCP